MIFLVNSFPWQFWFQNDLLFQEFSTGTGYIVIVIIKIIWNLWDSFWRLTIMETTEKKSLLLWTLTNMKDMQYVKSTMAGAKPIRHRAWKWSKDSSWDMLMLTSALLFKFK